MPAIVPPFLLAPLPHCLSLCLPAPIPGLISMFISTGYDGELIAGVLAFFPPKQIMPVSFVLAALKTLKASPDELISAAPADLLLLARFSSSAVAGPGPPPSLLGFYALLSCGTSSPSPGVPLHAILSPHLPPLTSRNSPYLSSLPNPPTIRTVSILPEKTTPVPDEQDTVTYFTVTTTGVALQITVPPTPIYDPPLPAFTKHVLSLSSKNLKSLILTRGGTLPPFPEKPSVQKTALELHNPPPSSPPSLPCLILSHGNAADIGLMSLRSIELSIALTAVVVSYDYSGYGSSPPVPSPPGEAMRGLPRGMALSCTESAVYKNIADVYDFVTSPLFSPSVTLASSRPVEIAGIYLYGQSVGSGPSVWLASELGKGPVREKCDGGKVCQAVGTAACCCGGWCCR